MTFFNTRTLFRILVYGLSLSIIAALYTVYSTKVPTGTDPPALQSMTSSSPGPRARESVSATSDGYLTISVGGDQSKQSNETGSSTAGRPESSRHQTRQGIDRSKHEDQTCQQSSQSSRSSLIW
ncbi:hypothetical protein BU23DRAFT_246144 [Bimuria novae-zelandiae CBS 107.79]|uniref:Uncharacterized protein n=1 Tax=Bimuria novae-zelandiae CBS 107.79 TaxID=1447943 RepID=A0A6A5V6J8_9PLEO|nr:hypothetical protein BU23DRAFT_246144 [Bimuria novae-zelandiae CBS 107.79]